MDRFGKDKTPGKGLIPIPGTDLSKTQYGEQNDMSNPIYDPNHPTNIQWYYYNHYLNFQEMFQTSCTCQCANTTDIIPENSPYFNDYVSTFNLGDTIHCETDCIDYCNEYITTSTGAIVPIGGY